MDGPIVYNIFLSRFFNRKWIRIKDMSVGIYGLSFVNIFERIVFDVY